MKKTCTILCSMLGGAALGCLLTKLIAPKKAAELHEEIHQRIMGKLSKIQEHISSCHCTMEDGCSCSTDDGADAK